MSTRSTPAAARRQRAASWMLVLVCFTLCHLPSTARAAHSQWTPLYDLGGEAIHLALLPDPDTGYPNRHSRLVWWQNRTTGNVLRWPRPTGDDCATFPTLPTIGAWSPGAEIFCSGHVPLDGRLMTFGGTETQHTWGITDARTYDPVTGLWSERPSMGQARWYPTATVLRDGRALVAAGNKGEQLWLFGGRRGGTLPPSPTGDSLFRFGRATERVPTTSDGYWDPSVVPLADGLDRPAIREGHTVALLLDPFQSDPNVRAQFLFGGRNAAGDPVASDVWVLRRGTGGSLDLDYSYQWRLLAVQGARPEARSEHTAVARSSTELFIFGGLKKVGGNETPTNELWRLYRDPLNPTQWLWQQISADGTPSARWGHAAVYQPATAYHGERMLVFGGAETPGAGGTLAESRVWAYDFEDPEWSEVLTRDDDYTDRPLPRRDHVMISDPLTGDVVLHGGFPPIAPDTLWKLNTEELPFPQPARWEELLTGGTSPGPRAGHSATYDYGYGLVPPLAHPFRRLYIFGGTVGNPPQPADKVVYMVEPWAWPRPWYPSREAPFSLSNHTADLDPYGLMFARTPEIYDPVGDTWTQSPATSWDQQYYPLHFVVPGNPSGGGRVVAVGGDPQARYLDIPASGPAGSWLTVGTGGSGVSGFNATSGVMYEPGKILIAGGAQGTTVVGTSKTLDASLTTNGWVNTNLPDMAPRVKHNLVLLPTGEVLAVGGVTAEGNSTISAQHCPQLWSPESRRWTPIGDLACDVDETYVPPCPYGQPPCPVIRNYHSTALLLPDARVISAGGYSPNPFRFKARIFCPPYLFKPNVIPAQFAPRPVIASAPSALTWGQVFTICTPNPDAVQKVCLIRSGSTTHSFDENQRYIELTSSVTTSGPPRLFVTAPASRDHAPPGDYLLFLVGSSDGTGTYSEAPSIAEWVRLQAPSGVDLCDAVRPGTLTGLQPDVIGPNEVWCMWTAKADDADLPASGFAQSFDLRADAAQIGDDTAWAGADHSSMDESIPNASGTWGTGSINGLAPCTSYYWAVRALDDNTQLSEFHPPVFFGTACGGGGGGSSAHAARGEEGGGVWSAGAGPIDATSAEQAAGTLVLGTRRTAEGYWQVSLRLATEADGLDPHASSIHVGWEDEQGNPQALRSITPDETQTVLGICSLRERGRVVVPGVYRLDQVLARIRHGSQDYALAAAQHSRLGSLGSEFLASGGSVELLDGDLIELIYEPATQPLQAAPPWYLLVRRMGAETPAQFGQRRSLGEGPPERFALHGLEPNPTGTPAVIRFDLPGESRVRLEVFDLLGRRVATLVDEFRPPGRYGAAWDLRDPGGARVPPGVYLCRMTAGEFRARRKLSVLP